MSAIGGRSALKSLGVEGHPSLTELLDGPRYSATEYMSRIGAVPLLPFQQKRCRYPSEVPTRLHRGPRQRLYGSGSGRAQGFLEHGEEAAHRELQAAA